MKDRFVEHDRDPVLRERLNEELSGIIFNDQMKAEVIRRSEKPISFWNRELVIPIPAAVVIGVMLIAAPFVGWQQLTANTEGRTIAGEQIQKQDRLVVLSSGVFYQSQLEGRGADDD